MKLCESSAQVACSCSYLVAMPLPHSGRPDPELYSSNYCDSLTSAFAFMSNAVFSAHLLSPLPLPFMAVTYLRFQLSIPASSTLKKNQIKSFIGCMCACTHVQWHSRETQRINWVSEWVLSFCLVGSRGETWLVSLDSRCFHPPSHPQSPIL